MSTVFALVGNQNSGKTTLFNQLTGSNQHVGNWPGVTVDKKEGTVRGNRDVTVVDLPGIYSLSPYTTEEVISRNFILSGEVDGIINIVDATNIERNLYLSLQLAEIGLPMVIALNMMDEIRTNGDSIDTDGLERELGIPIVPISARNNEGIDKLIRRAVGTVKNRVVPPVHDICTGDLHEALHAIGSLVENRMTVHNIPQRYAASKLVERDPLIERTLELNEDDLHIITEIVSRMENRTGLSGDAALADARYRFLVDIVERNVKRKRRFGEPTLSNKIDRVLTNKYLALPIFLLTMLLVFNITFGPVGTFLSDTFVLIIDTLIGAAAGWLEAVGVSPFIYGLVVEGALAGVGSVLGFMPIIVVLFLCLSILEDSGYMARAAFVMDKLLRKLGLSGRSFIPLIMGFGCSVPAVMSARTLSSERDRRLTIILTPFMSCGAKVPIYALFVAVFFKEHQALAMMGIYLIGIAVAILSGLILNRTILSGEPIPFVMELPAYRVPTFKSVMLLLWDKARDFLVRAFTLIFASTVVIWLLSNIGPSLQMVEDSGESILAFIGSGLAWFFKPLGFGTWQAATSVLTGFMAKEAVVGTMGVLYGVGETAAESGDLAPVIAANFTALSAFSFMVFNLLCMPCVAATAAIRREMNSLKWGLFTIGYQTAAAWIVSFVIYQAGSLLL
jgi:ferrous iron transport protein B